MIQAGKNSTRRRFPRVMRLAALVLIGLLLTGFALDRAFPPDLSRYEDRSPVVTDHQGQVLRAFLSTDQKWRLAVTPAAVDPLYRDLLLAVEDQRFAIHPGVDPLAVLRAIAQALRHGRIISGASTLTMQTARLLEPRPRTLGTKLIEMARAVQLEARLTKEEILSIYLTLAPYGGNLEGVVVASRRLFGKPPALLTPAEAALLVALPQDPNARRPDRHPSAARAARAQVLARGVDAGVVSADAARTARETPVPTQLQSLPFLAPHATARVVTPASDRIRTTLDAGLQDRVERHLRQALPQWPAEANAAALVVHAPTATVEAYAGSADFFSNRRDGMMDLTRAVRSPGSALKPFIYGIAFRQAIAHPLTRVDDRGRRFADYAPRNFDGGFAGQVTVTEALRRSLNIPAVAVLDRLGPAHVDAALDDAGVRLRFDRQAGAARLPLALGGVGITLTELVRLYIALADDGHVPMRLRLRSGMPEPPRAPLLDPVSTWYLRDILATVPPAGAVDPAVASATRGGPRIAYKTGTAYGHRDAWAIGLAGEYVIGVWVGRPDGAPCAGCTGYGTAAPLLFAIARGLPAQPRTVPGPAPPGAITTIAQLPRYLRDLDGPGTRPEPPGRPITLAFPRDGITLPVTSERTLPLKATGGTEPLTWLVNGRPLTTNARRWDSQWQPDGGGYHTVRVIDANGQTDEATVHIQPVRSGGS